MIPSPPDPEMLVVGAGFAGMYTVIHAVRRGIPVLGIDVADDVGGTWYWNRYPGARCDVESIDYSYSFDPELEREWRWSERYATQPEILRYLRHVADRYDVRRHYRFGVRLVSADWEEDAQLWRVGFDDGTSRRVRWLVMASGALSERILPDIPGRDDFAGASLSTAAWPDDGLERLEGRRVAVIGTGSSGVQAIPLLAARARELVVYQRSANYSIPAFNRDLDDAEWEAALAAYPERRRQSWAGTAGSPWDGYGVEYDELDEEQRDEVLENAWHMGGVLFAKAFRRQTVDPAINDAARRFFEAKLRERVADPATRQALTPSDHALGAKRICTDSGYFETYNLPHVHLVDLRREPIVEITADGITTAVGARQHDAIVYATGFDGMTGSLTSPDLRGRDGRTVREAWAEGPVTFLGVGLPGFPNLFPLNGPGTPSVLANMALTSEQQGDYVLRLIEHCRSRGFTSVEARADAARDWTRHGLELADATLVGQAPSWYTGANVAGKARGFLPYIGGFAAYIRRSEEIADAGYDGFVLSRRSPVAG